jgi:uncharacterized protein (TIGR02265 family)
VAAKITDSREVLDGGNVKGGMLKAHLQWVAENRPGLTIDDLRRRLSPATATVLGQAILPVSWYPFRAVVETDRAIAAACGGDAEALITELGRYSARLNLGTSYKVYTRSEPHAFFQLAARLNRQFQDFGRAEYERTGPTSCRLSMSGYPCFSPVFCLSGLGYYEQATALQGGRDPRVAETKCQCRGGSECRFDIRWT